jgi:hypothetical protein
VHKAALVRGIESATLHTWLRQAGVLQPTVRGRAHRVLSKVIDRVVAERRARYQPRRAA